FNYTVPITLPVKLETFTANYTKPNVTLGWKSADETDFSHYELQHSLNGKDFTATSIVFAEGGSALGASYTYIDKSVKDISGIIYYRLKMVDNNGQFTYSAVRTIHLGDEQVTAAISVYPNPATNSVHITFPASWQSKAVTLQLFNSNGQQVNTLRFDNGGVQSIQTSSLNKGIYFIRATAGFESLTSQVIKN
ncbi:MAG TPA: T9SS type A sorting domain-containing protein, partial [Chitinophagaceae bacterium]